MSTAGRLLQTHLVGTPEEHVDWLLGHLDPPRGGLVIDAGSGVGEVSRRMAEKRPDLRFLMVNTDSAQLDISPSGAQFQRHHGSYCDIPLPPASADAVMFCYSLGYARLGDSLREAARLLKPGGRMLVYEPTGDEGTSAAMEKEFGYEMVDLESLVDAAQEHGFAVEMWSYPAADSTLSREFIESFGEHDVFERTFAKVSPLVVVLALEDRDISGAIRRHSEGGIALQFSGGKDSLACLHLLKPYWDRLTVYWLNAGAPYPETLEVIERVRALVPRFVEVPGQVRRVQGAYGIPSDMVPVSATLFGREATGAGPMIVDRFTCCYLSIMQPMHDRMHKDGITLIVRGQKNADYHKGPFSSGEVSDGFELLYPLEGWTDAQVLAYLEAQGVELPRFYREGLTSSPDCMCCSAWWEEGKAPYLKRHHPEAYRAYMERLDLIARESRAHLDHFDKERG